MASKSAEEAVRDYLVALKDPSSLRDDKKIAELERRLSSSKDELERIRLRQQILDSESPSLDRYEEAFVEHAKGWASDQGISSKAFAAEGVPADVLRRAGLDGGRARGRGGAKSRRTRSRVTADTVRSALPRGTFTLKQIQERTGASPGMIRKVVTEAEADGKVKRAGTDPDHRGPGRAPTLYRKG